MNKKPEEAQASSTPNPVLRKLRAAMPRRALAVFEHYVIAERQASELHTVLGQTGPAVDLAWLTKQPAITVVLQPRWRMEGLSGLTTFADGQWVIGINKGNPLARRRFTLAHELKHLVDANLDRVTYASVTDVQREQIADYFAACYLMPKAWVRKSWIGGIQDTEALAGLFKVSVQAMDKRLRYLGFIDDEPTRPVATYFRLSNRNSDLAA